MKQIKKIIIAFITFIILVPIVTVIKFLNWIRLKIFDLIFFLINNL